MSSRSLAESFAEVARVEVEGALLLFPRVAEGDFDRGFSFCLSCGMLSGKEEAFAARRSGLPGDLLRPLDDPLFGIPRCPLLL